MKTKYSLIIVLAALTACNASTVVLPEAPINSFAAPTPEPTVTPSPSPTPSPTPTPTASPYAYHGGSGTTGDPYVLATAEDVTHITDNPAAIFEMNQSISMGSTPVQQIPVFSGQIRGNGFELGNLTMSASDGSNVSLIGELAQTGIVTGIKFTNVSISSNGHAAVICQVWKGRISFTEITGTITSGLGGNGHSGGPRPAYVSKVFGAQVNAATQDVFYNGNHLTGTIF